MNRCILFTKKGILSYLTFFNFNAGYIHYALYSLFVMSHYKCSGCLFAFWVLVLSTSFAQPSVLQTNIERLRYLRDLEQKALVKNDSVLLGKVYYQIGIAHSTSGSNTMAKEFFLKALRVLSAQPESYELGMTYLRIVEGMNLTPTSRQDIDYSSKALAVFRRINSSSGIARAYNYLTSAYKRIWVWSKNSAELFRQDSTKYDRVVLCINRIAHFARQTNDTSMLVEHHLQSGDLYLNLNDERAITQFNKALALQQSGAYRNDTTAIHTLAHLVSAYVHFGQYDQARQKLILAQQYHQHRYINDYWMQTHLYEVAQNYYVKTSQWQQAFDCSVFLSRLYSYRATGERDQIISALNARYEVEKKETQLRAQATELTYLHLQQRLTLATSALLIITAGMSIVFYRLNRKNQRISRHNAALVKEQNHRVKNNLQVVSSLLSLQAKRLTDETAKKAVEESRLRIESMAILHRRLYDGDTLARVELDTFVPEVVSGVLNAYGRTAVQLKFGIDAISLSTDKAVPLGLILNELTTNACKYAFPAGETPYYSVSCRRHRQFIELEVADNGPGLDGPGLINSGLNGFTTSQPIMRQASFGMQLIQAQVDQLRGTYQFYSSSSDNISPGTRFSMRFTG